MNDLLKYFHPENITKGVKATVFGTAIFAIATVAFFTKNINVFEWLAASLVSTIFLFAGPKKESN